MRRLRFSQLVPRERERIFPFFEKAENLALITPAWLGFRVLSPLPVATREGQIIDYQIRLLGLPVRWRSLIAHYDPPVEFVDEQLIGPYAYWRHLHRFEATPGGTRLLDEVEYRLPGWLPGPVAELVDCMQVRPQLEAIFAYRRRVFNEMFGDAPTVER